MSKDASTIRYCDPEFEIICKKKGCNETHYYKDLRIANTTRNDFENDELKYIRFVIRKNIEANGLCEKDIIVLDKMSVLLGEMTQDEVDMKNEY